MSGFGLDCVNFDVVKMQDRLDRSPFEMLLGPSVAELCFLSNKSYIFDSDFQASCCAPVLGDRNADWQVCINQSNQSCL